MAIILGCDPGSLRTGWALIESQHLGYLDSGVIHLGNSTVDLWSKYRLLGKEIGSLLERYHPEILVLEKAFVSLNKDAALKIAQIRGMIAGCCLHQIQSYAEYTPREIKQAVTGYGAAEKEQVAFMVLRQFPQLKSKALMSDESDAIAIALCHGHFLYQQRRQGR